jgi:hypothetical protein
MMVTMPQDSKAWIAGVVVGPLAGLALGAVLVWFLLGKRRERKAESNPNPSDAGFVDNNDRSEPSQSPQITEDKYYHTYVRPPVYQELDSVRRHELDSMRTSSEEPAELWHGNYGKSRTDISETSNWI